MSRKHGGETADIACLAAAVSEVRAGLRRTLVLFVLHWKQRLAWVVERGPPTLEVQSLGFCVVNYVQWIERSLMLCRRQQDLTDDIVIRIVHTTHRW